MSNQNPHSLRNQLLAQDSSLHTSQYKEHRMQLELKLQQAQWREKWTGVAVGVAFVLAIALMFVNGNRLFGSPDPYDASANILSVSLGVLHAIAIAISGLGLASYYSRIRPAVRKASDNLRDESIRELREECHKLRQQVSDLKKSGDA